MAFVLDLADFTVDLIFLGLGLAERSRRLLLEESFEDFAFLSQILFVRYIGGTDFDLKRFHQACLSAKIQNIFTPLRAKVEKCRKYYSPLIFSAKSYVIDLLQLNYGNGTQFS